MSWPRRTLGRMSKLQASITLALLLFIAGPLVLAEVRRGAPPPLPAYDQKVSYECIFRRLTLASASAKSAATQKDIWQ